MRQSSNLCTKMQDFRRPGYIKIWIIGQTGDG